MDLRCLILLLNFGLCLLSVQAHPGIGLVYDGDHYLYYTDLEHIWQLDTETGQKSIYVANVHTHELVVDEQGNLYGEHYWYEESKDQFWNYIWVKRKEGSFEKIRENSKGENEDFGFVRDSDFRSYTIVPRNGVFEITRIDSIGPEVWHRIDLNRPGWSYLTRKGDILFSDYPRIYRADSTGIGILAADLSSSRFPFSMQDKTHHIYGIWEDHSGAVYVALYGGRQVQRISPQKKIERVFKTGLFWSPINGVFDRNEDLWLMEARMDGAIRIRKIEGNQLMAAESFRSENVVLLIVLLLILGIILIVGRKFRSKNPFLN